MMVMRRYLTSLYDWTGFSRKFYTSEKFEILAVAIVAILVGLGMVFFHGKPSWEHANLNSVWPSDKIEIADLIMAAVLSFFLLSNVFRCFLMVMGDLAFKVPLKLYLSQAKELILHTCTQKRFGLCDDKKQWFIHLMIMTGYASVFLMVVVLINGLTVEGLKFQRDWPEYPPVATPIRLLGYYSTFAIMYGTTYALIGRLKKSKPVYKNSHPTDWMFLILLQLTTMTGIFVHFTRLLDWPMATYVIYVIHMMVAIPMLVLEVPFAKWAHLAYRPVVLYLLKVKELYRREQEPAIPEGAAAEAAVQR